MKNKIFKIFTVAMLLIIVVVSCKKESLSGISIEKSLLISVGETVKLTPTFVPSNAHNKKVSWESKNSDVATVDNNGNVTGKSVGQSIVRVITKDGGRTAQCIVTVLQPIEPEEMIWVEGGTFTMGAYDGDFYNEYEFPRHEVTLSGFYISKYMVTQKEWIAAMGSGGNPGYAIGESMPAWTMNWDDIQEYIIRLNAHTGKNYRLPTEAEWEHAARGGNQSKGYKYSGSNNLDEVAWYDGNYDASIPLRPVGQKNPNELGIYDMSGNMWECCSDYWGSYTDIPQTNPTGPNAGVYRVMRGGAFGVGSFCCRNSYRHSASSDCYGFRLVLPVEKSAQ